MARASTSNPKPKQKHGGGGKGTKAKANAAGYLKRKSTKTAAPRIDDVYELVDNEDRRRKGKGKGRRDRKETTELEYDFGEDAPGRSAKRNGTRDNDEDEDEDMDGTQPRLFGEGDVIDSDEDEEIDSDDAFEDVDGDADGFGGVFSRKSDKSNNKSKRSVRFAEVNLDEDEEDDLAHAEDETEEEEEEEDSDTFIDILDVLDGKGQVWNEDSDNDDDPPPKKPPPGLLAPLKPTEDEEDQDDDLQDDQEDSLDEEVESADDDAMEEDEDDPFTGSGDDEPGDGSDALDALHTFISGLPSAAPSTAKRKAETEPDAAPRKKRVVIKERTQAGAEGQFHVGGSQKVSLADLLAPLSTPLSAVEKSLGAAPIQGRQVVKQAPGRKAGLEKGGALAAPLPLRTQDRIDRVAAYEATKEEAAKWDPTMRQIREAEHLSFPLQPEPGLGRVSNADLASTFKARLPSNPSTKLESAVSKLLAKAQLAEDADITRTENELMAAKLTPEEVIKRRAELRQMRELAFRGEMRAKRVAKIKSKTYRKIARGRKERQKALEGEDGGEDGEDSMQREVDRARARAGLRVKRSAKWSKAKDGQADSDDEMGVRREIENELDRKEQLARLIRGSGEDGDDDSDGDDQDESEIKRRAFDEIQSLQAEEDDSVAKQKGVFGMKFMQDAARRQMTEARQTADDFLEEMGMGADEESGAEGTEDVVTTRTGGRMTLQPVKKLTKRKSGNSGAAAPADVTESETMVDAREVDGRPAAAPKSLLSAEVNPWLTETASGPKAPRGKNQVVVSKDSKNMDKARHKLSKNEKKLDKDVVSAARDDDRVEIEMSHVMGGDDSDENSEVEAQEQALLKNKKKGVHSFEQRDLVARAFAGDNVVKEFEEAKRQEIASDAPKEIDTTLAGWGSWGGPLTQKKKPNPKFVKKIPGVAAADRADANKAHIIISEKKDKKAAKYLVKDVPYPYTSRAQYERSMQTPLGTEWNTRVGFQKGTLPKVVKKMGTVIEPLKKLS
ncbi:unnamed protein product [Mycena citricolor]|uniref:Utp14-domain-containing protein n=1 Tax=Mycena citricolor TaxID=2018698 RepID=A0AAD2H179_9AGAR|nr:unnamed protein product [Mycena citricolor]